MKKVGIITLPLKKNYGGLLQSYALQAYLSKKGYEVILIDRRYNESSLTPLKNIVRSVIFPKKHKQIQASIESAKNAKYFREKYISPKTEEILSEKQLAKITEEYKFDAVIVGSDQVWRPEYSSSVVYNLFLDFIKDESGTKIMSYAASFGVADWSSSAEITENVSRLIKRFDHISVREDSGVDLCKKEFNVDAIQHVDPTMLLEKEDYENLVIAENEPKREGSILAYMLDQSDERKELLKFVEDSKKGKVFHVNENDKTSKNPNISPTVTSWVKGFMDADFVVVDSFHGCVFSIIFNKPFIAFGNKRRGLTRFTSLFKQFNLEDRLILNKEDLSEELINKPIDWSSVNKILKECRLDSSNYLEQI